MKGKQSLTSYGLAVILLYFVGIPILPAQHLVNKGATIKINLGTHVNLDL